MSDKMPVKIYLQHVDDDGDETEITWCEDKIYNGDVVYVRADVVIPVLAAVAQPPYHDSKLSSLLETLQGYAQNALDIINGNLTTNARDANNAQEKLAIISKKETVQNG